MSKRILIVDDDPGVRKTFSGILAERGHTMFEAADGQEAINITQQEKPDVILLDTVLPYACGHEICSQIKKMEGINPKIIVYTGHVDAVNAEKAREAGADDYVVKTPDLSYLLGAIENV